MRRERIGEKGRNRRKRGGKDRKIEREINKLSYILQWHYTIVKLV